MELSGADQGCALGFETERKGALRVKVRTLA